MVSDTAPSARSDGSCESDRRGSCPRRAMTNVVSPPRRTRSRIRECSLEQRQAHWSRGSQVSHRALVPVRRAAAPCLSSMELVCTPDMPNADGAACSPESLPGWRAKGAFAVRSRGSWCGGGSVSQVELAIIIKLSLNRPDQL
jgi:hypothetical protein